MTQVRPRWLDGGIPRQKAIRCLRRTHRSESVLSEANLKANYYAGIAVPLVIRFATIRAQAIWRTRIRSTCFAEKAHALRVTA